MTNYVRQVGFSSKDGLVTGNPNKLIRGSEFDSEFNAIKTAVNSKANSQNATITGTSTAVNFNITGITTLTGTIAGTFIIDGGTF